MAILQKMTSTPPTIHEANQVLVKPAQDQDLNPKPQVLTMLSANMLTNDQEKTNMAKAPIMRLPRASTTSPLVVAPPPESWKAGEFSLGRL